ncbi:tRNA glutamyl-Q(34) synthetase GluQRS [Caulobacter ginsengisoli]|uniref:tRNA glutamyl-Q(34) synthetase GluQRS n=1 Tax=Caulobacter ginsengisoli TaxID=400775 RepID=UPI0027D8C7DD|nr:tRNA glutamyl-Q(34) synthetase GluQRS [Caulobacter ginsengisoli]
MVFATRFAPSPTGFLHRGHAFSALTAFRAAQAAKGRFVLRIEDIDATRCRPEYESAIFEDLAWLGLEWEQPVRRQSEHLADYEAALEKLRGQGLLYRCFRTRKQVAEEMLAAPHGPVEAFRGGPLHPNEEERMLEEDRPFAWRLSLDAAAERVGGFGRLSFYDNGKKVRANPALAGDVVLARKDVGVAYHLAVVVDDALQGIDHVIRGEDLAEATHIQRLLQALLDLPTPTYRQHRLLTGPDGRRYAKRDKAETLRDLRAQGVTAEQLRAELGFD